MTINNCKEYKKLDHTLQKAVDECINKLQERYSYYKDQSITITNLFGDGNIIHKVLDNGFYVYKSQFNRIQVRLLYTVNENDNIDVVYFYVKNGNNLVNIKGNKGKRYLQLFQEYVDKKGNEVK